MPGMVMPGQGGEGTFISRIRDLEQLLMQAQVMGGNPMQIGSLQLALQNAHQDYQRFLEGRAKNRQRKQLEYAQKRGHSTMGTHGRGGGPGRDFEETMALIGFGGLY